MVKTTTQDQIIEFYYGELAIGKSAALCDEVKREKETSDLFDKTVDALEELKAMQLSPSQSVVNRITHFSKNFQE